MIYPRPSAKSAVKIPMLRFVSSLLALAAVSACSAETKTAARFGIALDGRPITAARLETLSASFGARPGVVVVFEQWPEKASGDLVGLGESLSAIRASGATPVVTWEPMFYRADGTEVIILAEDILGGRYDAYADAFAALLAAQPGEVIVRLMHEPNLARYHWGVAKEAYDARAPEVYKLVWRHLVARVRAAAGTEGAKRIRFAFCPNCESVPATSYSPAHVWNTLAAYWPGAEWVDVVGVDGYNWGDTQTPAKHGWQSSWRGFADVLGPAVAELRALAPGKPLYIFETATAPTGGDKAAWLRDVAATAKQWDVAALCWFEANKEVDWRLGTDVSPEAVKEFVGELASP
jgi:mannan endo-1,4-beta-mannosidase